MKDKDFVPRPSPRGEMLKKAMAEEESVLKIVMKIIISK
jgi:hypothetical protein